MKALLLITVAASASLAASTLGAQVKSPKADSTCTKYSDGRIECRVYRFGPDSAFRKFIYNRDSALAKRAALGLELRTTGSKRDSLGVFVEAVTPKGPAELAGIVEGDRIAAINGVDLRTPAADTDDAYESGLASHRLTREVQKLTPGARVTLRVYSGGRFRDVQVTAGKASEVLRLGNGFRFRMPMDGMMEFNSPDMMMFGPKMQLMRERMPMIRKQLEPMLRERLNDLPRRIELRTLPRVKSAAPLRVRSPSIYKVDRDDEEWNAAEGMEFEKPFQVDDGESFYLDDEEPFEFEDQIDTVSPEVIRELAATAIRDARVSLARLAADGIV